MQLPLIPADKGTHIVCGAVITLLTAVAFKNAAIGASIGCAVGALKEVVDYSLAYLQKRKNEPVTHGADVLDFVATAAGALFSYAALLA